MKKMIAALLVFALAFSLFAFTACNKTSDDGEITAVTDNSITASEANGPFSITTQDGEYSQNGNVYTITKSGSYAFAGRLEGQVVVAVASGDSGEVLIELTGTTIICDNDSPLKITSGNDVDVSAKKGSENILRDARAAKTASPDNVGEGAISAACDLKIKGTGILVVEGGYYYGIYTTKELKIQKLMLKVTAYNAAIRANDSVSVLNGEVVAISTHGDGIKTKNTNADKSGNTRGDIVISGGYVTVYAAGDGIQAAHGFEMTLGEEVTEAPVVNIYTGSYSGHTASDAATTSYKGVKAEDEIVLKDGSITLNTYDDGLHANSGTEFDAGGTGKGNINISGGSVTMVVYAPANKTATGRTGPGGWQGQQSVVGADGIHADGELNISGGTIDIDSSYEGLEANVINVSGGKTKVAGNDDGINACKGAANPQINVSGGYLEVSVSPSGDTDGIDSNGTYTQTGGVVITRGPNSQMAGAIDADGAITVSGGTLIVLGYGNVQTSGNVQKVGGLSLHSSGEHSVKIGGTKYTFTNSSEYGATNCYSDATVA